MGRPAVAFKCLQKNQPCATTTDRCKGLVCDAASGTCQPVVSPGPSGNCQSGLLKCKGQCTDPQTDLNNCGACGTACAAPANGSATCASGTCVTTCTSGFELCKGACVDEGADPDNCGACGVKCPSGSCKAGFCQCFGKPELCPAGETCLSDGLCAVACKTNADCGSLPGYVCDGNSGLCLLSCTSDSDCLSGQTCVGGVCGL